MRTGFLKLISVLSLVLFSWGNPGLAEPSAQHAIGEKQAAPKRAPAVAQGKDAPINVQTNSFTVTRPLGFYGNRLGDEFVKDLGKLGKNSHWIDGGSGEGVAIEHYHQLGKNGQALAFTGGESKQIFEAIGKTKADQRAYVTGITYHMVRNVRPTYDNRLRHLVGRLMEDIPNKEIGRADLISDLYGVFAYSNRLDQAMAKYLTALKSNGKMYIFWGARMNETTMRVGGRNVPVLDWLRTIPGITVEGGGPGAGAGVIKITKTGDPIRIPRLEFVSETNQSPPVRRFNQIAGTIDIPQAADGVGPGVDFAAPLAVHNPATPANPFSPEATTQMNEMLGYRTMNGGR